MTRNRLVHLAATLGLVAGALVASTGPAGAATPVCETAIAGITPDNRVMMRYVRGLEPLEDDELSAPLPFSVKNLLWFESVKVSGGLVHRMHMFTAGQRPRNVSVKDLDSTTGLNAYVTKTYRSVFSPRLVADSGSYYVYGVDANGNLKRWTRFLYNDGSLGYGDPRIVAPYMNGLKTLSYWGTLKVNGVWNDFVYATTTSGRFKQIRIPLDSPSADKQYTLATSGFESYNGLSLSWCNESAQYHSVIAIDEAGNQARWFTLYGALSPKPANFVDRGQLLPESDWHLHATT